MASVIEQKAYDRTTEWNNAGWTGAGINVWNREGLEDHGIKTRARIGHAAPGATIYNYNHYMTINKNKVTNEFVDYNNEMISGEDFIKRNNITILTESRGAPGWPEALVQAKAEYFQELRNSCNILMFNSGGNNGADGVMGGALPEVQAVYAGACMLMGGKPKMASYSSLGDEYEEIDFSTFTGTWSGTSFASPYLAGISALLQQRYGTDITQNEVYAYFKMIAQPIDTGHMADDRYDYWSGYGIPILPHVDKKYIRMTIGSTNYKIDGNLYSMDTAPFIKDKRTFVPIAFVALALGAKVSWDGKAKKVTIVKNNSTLEMYIDKKTYYVNKKEYKMDTAPFIKDSRTFVPIAFAALALNCKVAWCAEDGKVLILEQ